MYEIESVLDYILANPEQVKMCGMANAWLWVAAEVQQHVGLPQETGFAFADNNAINRWSLESLNEDMRREPHPRGQFANPEQRMKVQAEEFNQRVLKDHASALEDLRFLLRMSKPATEFNPIRTAAKERAEAADAEEPPWLFDRIVTGLKAQRVEKNLFGDTIFVDVE